MAPQGQTRTKLIETVRDLSLSQGFPATSVDEVCAKAGVSKGSFYHHFASKEDIGHAALEDFFAGLVAAFTQGPFTEVADPVERLLAFVAHAEVVCAGPVLQDGCLLGSFALDLAESDPIMRAKLAEQFGAIAGFVAALITDASDAAGLDLAADQFALQFLAIIEGSIVLAKAHDDPKMLTSGVALFGDHLELLFSPSAG